MSFHGTSVVAGFWANRGNGATWRATEPATGRELEPAFEEAGLVEITAAVASAEAAAEGFAAATPGARADLLEAIAEEIEKLGEPLLERCRSESGLPASRIAGERGRTCAQLRTFAAIVREGSWVDARIDTAIPDRQPAPRPELRRMLRAIGPVAVFGASNFPLAFSVAGGDTAAALAAGCPVVVKAHPAHPGTSELVAEAIVAALARCGLDPRIFSMVHGGAKVGLDLVKQPGLRAVGFTGSTRAGRALMDAAASRPVPIPVFAEMSSVNPLIVTAGALAQRSEAISEGLVNSFTLGTGQFCTKPGIVFIPDGPAGVGFAGSVGSRTVAAQPGLFLTPGIRTNFASGLSTLGTIPNVNLKRGAIDSGPGLSGRAAVAITDAATFLKEPRLADEVFGPVALLVRVRSTDELLACLKSMPGQLTATIHATDGEADEVRRLAAALASLVGRIIFNGFPTGVEVAPAMTHGGPYPASSDSRFTSVGTAAILRFARPVTYQGFPEALLPDALRNANPLEIMRTLEGRLTREPLR